MSTDAGFRVAIAGDHGGRWTSLRDPNGQEWLWSRDAPGREAAQPGDAFVDVGGVEECFPTIGGHPDHGDVWSRSWTAGADGWWSVVTGTATLSRRLREHPDLVSVDYHLRDLPGRRFIWAAHMSFLPTELTRVIAPDGHRVRAWPGHVHPVETSWPDVLGIDDYDRLGPDDGSAMFCILPDLNHVTVDAPTGRLAISVRCEGQPVGIGLWRNLGGYPWDTPVYRNFVIEPMLGQELTLARAGEDDCARVPESGSVSWNLTISQA